MNEFLYNPPSKLESVTVGGIVLRRGDRVRIQPKARVDTMDIALAGRIALIESIEVDPEERTHLALVLEDDPAQRFFYTADEVEPLEGE